MDGKEAAMSERLIAQRLLDVLAAGRRSEAFRCPPIMAGFVRDEICRAERESPPQSNRCPPVLTVVPHPLAFRARPLLKPCRQPRNELLLRYRKHTQILSNFRL